MSFSLLMPGMESFSKRFEDEGDINVEVNVNDTPEAVQEEVATDEAVQEAAPVEAPAEAEEQAAEVVEMYFNTLEAHQRYLQKHGFTREFQMLANFDGRYNGILENKGLHVSGLEDISSSAHPGDAITMAALEGIGDALADFWRWVKDMCKKVWDFLKNLFSAITLKFGSIESRIARVKKMLNEREDNSEKKSDAKIVDATKASKSFNDYKSISSKFFGNSDVALAKLISYLNSITLSKDMIPNVLKPEYDNNKTEDDRKKMREDLKKAYADAVKDMKDDKSIEGLGKADASSILVGATNFCKDGLALKKQTEYLNKISKDVEKLAIKFEKMNGGDGSVKGNVRTIIRGMTGDQGEASRFAGMSMRMANAYLKGATTIMIKHTHKV